jgi:hypothetical protein
LNPIIKTLLCLLAIFIPVTIAIQYFLPWPWGFFVSIGLMTLFFKITQINIKRNNGAGYFGGFEGKRLQMICARCNTASNKRACPKCGSKIFNAR